MQDAAVDLETNADKKRVAELRETLADSLAELGNFSEAVQYYLATVGRNGSYDKNFMVFKAICNQFRFLFFFLIL